MGVKNPTPWGGKKRNPCFCATKKPETRKEERRRGGHETGWAKKSNRSHKRGTHQKVKNIRQNQREAPAVRGGRPRAQGRDGRERERTGPLKMCRLQQRGRKSGNGKGFAPRID